MKDEKKQENKAPKFSVKAKGGMFIISAPSGAGKTTLCRTIIKPAGGIRQSVSFTSRGPRKGESNDVDYTFISEPEFRKMIDAGDFVEWAVVHGNLYGTSRQRLADIMDGGDDVMLDIDTQGARQIKQSYPGGVFIFILPPSMRVLRERLESRKTNTPEDIENRLRRAMDEIRDYTMYDYVIVNDILEESVMKLEAIITSERLRCGKVDPDWIKEKILQL
jgi:guanylate kinase